MNSYSKLAILVSCLLFAAALEAETLKSGVLDLRNTDLSQKATGIQGRSEFYWQKLYGPEKFKTQLKTKKRKKKHKKKKVKALPEKEFSFIPGSWADDRNEKPREGIGYGTYRFVIKTATRSQPLYMWMGAMGTSYRLYINGALVSKAGEVGNNTEAHKPALFRPIVALSAERQQHEVILQVSNFEVQRGGVWDRVIIGEYIPVNRERNLALIFNLIAFGGLLIAAFYFFIVFLSWPREKPLVFFASLALLMALRAVLTGSRFFHDLLYPDGFGFLFRLEYLTFYLGVPAFLFFLRYLLPGTGFKWADWVFLGMASAYSMTVLFFEPQFFTSLLTQYQIVTAISMLYMIFIIVRSLLKKQNEGYFVLIGFIVIAFSVVNDLNYANTGDSFMGFEVGALSLVLFLMPLAVLLGVRLTRTSKQNYDLSEKMKSSNEKLKAVTQEMRETNRALHRFVPIQFLEMLEKPSVKELALRDHIQLKMGVLFADIREFTRLSESMSPQDNFNFVNSYLERITPAIEQNHGFVDKFIGDAIMALFRYGSDHAVSAAIDMQKELTLYNQHRAKQGYQAIKVGIGVHTGELMMGIIGAQNRWDSTVISDAVNQASRIENLTKTVGAKIAISSQAFYDMKDPSKYQYRFVGEIEVKGKTEKISVFEILDGYSDSELVSLLNTKAFFEKALMAFEKGEYQEAEDGFMHALKLYPDDLVANYYLGRCYEMKNKAED